MNRFQITVVFFLASMLMGVFLIWPKYQELNIKKAALFQKEIDLQSLQDHIAKIHSLSEELKNYSNETAKIDTALPTRFSPLSFLDYLKKTAAENGLSLNNYSLSDLSAAAPSPSDSAPEESDEDGPAPEESARAVKELSLDMSLSGFYPSLKEFLSVLERSSRLIEIENFSFSVPEEGEDEYNFSIGIKTYSY